MSHSGFESWQRNADGSADPFLYRYRKLQFIIQVLTAAELNLLIFPNNAGFVFQLGGENEGSLQNLGLRIWLPDLRGFAQGTKTVADGPA